MDKIILREYNYDFEFIGPTLVMIAYNKNENNYCDYLILEENKK